MLSRLHVPEGKTADSARKRFDGQLGVPGWGSPGVEHKEPEPREEGAPWWWSGAEDASQSFLRSMGVTLS